MRIGDHDTQEKVLVIAEVGNNHEGSFSLAKELLSAAVDAGADAVKFQTFLPEEYVTRTDAERFARLRSFQLSYDQFGELAELARKLGALFISTPFDLKSAAFLGTIVDAMKISSSDNTFHPLLRAAAGTAKPLLLSTGLATMEEIETAKNVVDKEWETRGCGDPGLALLHCVSAYPVPPKEANLSMIDRLRKAFDCTIGYSDHTLGCLAATLSVAAGARIVEKHFTLDKAYSDFRDHQLSADPAELKALVGHIREAETLLGSSDDIQPSEVASITAVRRSVAALKDLGPGEPISSDDITWVRPGTGIPVGNEDLVVGKRPKQMIRAGELILAEHLS